jgi:hypothetical protein
MADHPGPDQGLAGFAHRVIERLTVLKLRVGSLRVRARMGIITPEEVETHLAHIEQEIDATATLAQDMQVQGSSSR